ncbi:MAG TPA: cupredoxin domain-containing protein [Thermomicrobiales bacterium]|nr:cupredoxin domain-containing protein [Thermomicrobiales bacterium]
MRREFVVLTVVLSLTVALVGILAGPRTVPGLASASLEPSHAFMHQGDDDDSDDCEEQDDSGPGSDSSGPGSGDCEDDGSGRGRGRGRGGDDDEAGAAVPPAGQAVAPDGQVVVQIVDRSFSPTSVTVASGQSVTFVNASDDEHTATGSAFDTGTIAPGGSATVTLTAAGTYAYFCSFHPEMQGTIIVTDDGGAVSAGAGAVRVEAEGTPDAQSLVGSWRVTLTPADELGLPPQSALVTFAADGSLIAAYPALGFPPNQSPLSISAGHGTWQRTGEDAYDLTLVALLLDQAAQSAGTLTVHETGQFDGEVYQGSFTSELTTAAGKTLATGQGTTQGVRIAIEAAAATPGATPVTTDTAEAVTIRDFAFNPPTLEIPAGTTVTWINEDQAPHTATGDQGEFDSGRLDPGQSYSQTFDQPGTYAYHCDFHPEMTGTIIVT